MVITSFVIQKCYLTFNTVLSAFMGQNCRLHVHRSRQWHQTVQVVMVFFTGMQLLFLRKMHLLLRMFLKKALKITFWPFVASLTSWMTRCKVPPTVYQSTTCLWDKYFCSHWSRRLNFPFFHGMPLSFQRTAVVIQTQVFGRPFLENEWNEHVTLRKTIDSICCQR